MAQKSKHYIRAETDMKNLGIYKPEFDSMIAVYAQLMTQRDKLESEYKKGGYQYQVNTSSGVKKAPIVTTLEALRKDCLTYAEALGLTPRGLAKFDAKAFEKRKVGGLEQALCNLEDLE